MEELLKEYLGEIALLIYILYPLLKRAWDRFHKKGEPAARKPKKAAAKARTPKPPARKAPGRPQHLPAVAKASPQADFLAAARTQLAGLKQEATQLLARAEGDPRLLRLVPALR
ncbi:MAG: hypothetical protein WBN29_04535, partial [Polyangiales bacterium]